MKKEGKKELIFAILLIVLLGFILSAPQIFFISQIPSDIDTFNSYLKGVNITYNATDAGISASQVFIFYKTNSTSSDIVRFANGSSRGGYVNSTGINSSINWTFILDDNDIYPGSFVLDQDSFENTPHSFFTISLNNAVKIKLYNVSNATQYNVFEFMANSSVGASSVFEFYCNSSYTAGSILTNANCFQFGSFASAQTYNISNFILNTSRYQFASMPLNTTTGRVGTVQVTPISYLILRKAAGGTWAIYNVVNASNTTSTSANNGGLWTNNLTASVDAHLHQYTGTEMFRYYFCASNTSGVQNCSDERTDLLQLAGLPPSAPHVSSPASNFYSGNLTIIYNEAISPNSYSIVFYNISLYNTDETFNKTILNNNSLNLSYIWNPAGTPDGSYLIKVVATDNLSQTSFDFSDNFTIDNTNPSSSLECDSSYTFFGNTLSCSCTGADDTSGVASISYELHPSTASTGLFKTNCTVTDNAGNSAISFFSYYVYPVGVPSPSEPGAGPSLPNINQNQTIIAGNTSRNMTSNENIFSRGAEYTSVIAGNSRVAFNIENESHFVRVVNITADKVNISIFSSGINAALSIGEGKKFELTGDNYYDIYVKLNSIYSRNGSFEANLTLKTIHELIPSQESLISSLKTKIIEAGNNLINFEKANNRYFIFFSVIAIAVILFIVFRMLHKNHRLTRLEISRERKEAHQLQKRARNLLKKARAKSRKMKI